MAWFRTLLGSATRGAMLLLVALATTLAPSTAFARDDINAVLGDTSWIARYGVAPDSTTDPDARIRVHLEYVLARLRGDAAVDADLTWSQRAERARNLDRLADYIARAEFPRNHEYPGTRPHFIDDDGRICAVGYLIEQSAGRAVAESINARHEWDYLPAIRDSHDIAGLDAWIEQSGLSALELAMIQPGYPWQRPVPRPPPPPPDERTEQQRIIIATLAGQQAAIQACADRFEMWSTSVTVGVTIGRRSVDVTVPRVGSNGFRRCAQSTLESAIAQRLARRRLFPMSLHHAFAIAQDEDTIDEWRYWNYWYWNRDWNRDRDRDDNGFAQPPPR